MSPDNRIEHNTQPSSPVSPQDIKQKLYIKLMMRMSDKFGNDQKSLNIIKECLDLKLTNKQRIDASVIDQIQDDIQRRL